MKKVYILFFLFLLSLSQINAQSLSINTPAAVNESAGTQVYTVTLSAAQPNAVTVQYETQNASAVAGSDFALTTGVLTIPAGQTTGTITVNIINDFLFENTEVYYVYLTNAQSASLPFTISNPWGYGYINDDDPNISINYTVTSAENAGTQTFTVTLSSAQTYPVTMNYQTANGSAVAGNDYTAVSGSLTIPAGQTTASITITILDDYMNEYQEYYSIQILNAINASNSQPMTISSAYGYGYINDDDPSVSIAQAPTVNENAGTQAFTVTLSAAQTYPVSVQYQSFNGSALSGSDYTAVSGTLTIPAGQTTATINVPILNDNLFEYQEYYYVELSNAKNASNNMPMALLYQYGYGYIDDNDPNVSISYYSTPQYITEGVINQSFVVTLSAAQTYPVSVQYATFNGSAVAGTDYTNTSGTITIPAGQTTATILIPILDDYEFEYQEYYYITLSNAMNVNNLQPMTILTASGYGYIDDNDPGISISTYASPQYISESTASQTFTVTIPSAQAYAISVDYTTVNASATAGSDYVATSGTLTIPAGQTSATFTVQIMDDNVTEYQEYYYVQLSNAKHAGNNAPMTLVSSVSYAYIDDNDVPISISAPVPEFVNENGGTQVFTVSLSSAQSFPISVQYQSYSNSATAGSDFTSVSGTLVFNAGQTTKTITVPILDDNLFEYQESYYVQITNALNLNNSQPLSIGNAYAYGYITDNDPTLSISNASPEYVMETTGASQLFTVTLSAPQTYSVSVAYSTIDYTAVSGTDFTAQSGTLVFAPGDTSKTIVVPILNDFMFEYTEYYYISLTNALNMNNAQPMSIIAPNGYAYIEDNDPIVTITNPVPNSVTEADGAAHQYMVTLSAPQSYPITVQYESYDGSASAGSDYASASGTLTFAPGDSVKVITVPILNDFMFEYSEYYYMFISNAQNSAQSQPLYIQQSTAYAYIDDEDPTFSIQNPVPLTVAENGGTQLFTVTLSAPQTYATAVDYSLYGASAFAGSDFTFGICALTLHFAPGETTKVFSASIIDDGISEGTEVYYAQLTNARNTNVQMPMYILNPLSYAYIEDNDNPICGSNVLSKPVISGSTLYCPNTTISLSIAPVSGATGYVWKGPNGFTANGLSISIPNAAAIQSGVYTARAYRSGNTICDTSVGANVSVSVLPCASTVSLKVYIEGYYVDSGRMTTVLLNHGLSSSTTTTDSITIELHNTTPPYALAASVQAALNTNGTAIATFPSVTGQYYLVVKHKNALETWSATPVTIGALPTSYDFTNAASKAYGNNMKQIEPGIWALFSGDITQDGNIDLIDVSALEERINAFDNCFVPADINGDGNTDLLDAPMLEDNVNNFIYAIYP